MWVDILPGGMKQVVLKENLLEKRYMSKLLELLAIFGLSGSRRKRQFRKLSHHLLIETLMETVQPRLNEKQKIEKRVVSIMLIFVAFYEIPGFDTKKRIDDFLIDWLSKLKCCCFKCQFKRKQS